MTYNNSNENIGADPYPDVADLSTLPKPKTVVEMRAMMRAVDARGGSNIRASTLVENADGEPAGVQVDNYKAGPTGHDSETFDLAEQMDPVEYADMISEDHTPWQRHGQQKGDTDA